MNISSVYRSRMMEMLGDEYPEYEALLDEEPLRGFRVNTLKCTPEAFFEVTGIRPERTPFAQNSYYLNTLTQVGSSIPFHAGLFYMQEPSASSAVAVLHPEKGSRVLDLCAAPGSKSTQLSEYLDNTGLLVVNEFNSRRAQVLRENIERHGCANTIVLNADTRQIAETFPQYFDYVLCDAPCSGEGMLRKEPEALQQWSEGLVSSCAALQKEILGNAYACLKPGGYMVYSTCTLNYDENEKQMAAFVQEHPDMEIVPVDAAFGRPAFDFGYGTANARRIFPMDHGEGHFVCRLHKKEQEYTEYSPGLLSGEPVPKYVKEWLKEFFVSEYPYYYVYRDRVYGGLHPFINTGKCHLIRHQVYLGEIRNNRFEPSYAAFASSYTQPRYSVEVTDEEAQRFLRGETLAKKAHKGYVAVKWNGYTIGFGKCDGSVVKNKYPKEYRNRS